MIVRIMSSGSSFAGLSQYLTHDPKAKTDDRVAWTHTLNLAHDHVPSAVDEMLWTAREAEFLKQEAGIRAGGRTTENPVKHVSLNWAHDDDPTQAHMMQTSEEFLRAMEWHEHQAVLIAHDDKAHAHVHIMLNMIHPETGLKLDEGFEQRRAQKWALEYERAQGRIHCEQRLLEASERENAPTRPAWTAFADRQQEFERAENHLRAQEPIIVDLPRNSPRDAREEWKILKEVQRDQRLAFFAEGKIEFSDLRREIYREVREEFRERWSDYFEAKREGEDAETLAAIKAALVAEQAELLAARRDTACGELRTTRNDLYREMLEDQREMRAGLRARQELGLDNDLFLEKAGQYERPTSVRESFADNARDVADRPLAAERETDEPTAPEGSEHEERRGLRTGPDMGARVGEGIGFALIGFLDGIADGLVGGKPPPRRPPPEPEDKRDDAFEASVDAARQRQQQEDAEREWRRRQASQERD